MKRLTYQTVGDATRQAHYCAGYGIKKDAEFFCREDRNEADGLYDQLKKFVGGYADEV